MSNQIDHEVPLEQGGSNDKSNLRIRCIACHAAKTADETKALFKRQ
jgi:5-methylcytosine-specific restriction protein A